MSMSVRLAAEPELLQAVISGGFSLDEAKRTFREILDGIEEHRAEKILVDATEVSGEPKLLERFYYGEFVSRETMDAVTAGRVPYVPQFAYVMTPPVLDEWRFGETVARNRGMNVRTFQVFEDALAWLRPGRG